MNEPSTLDINGVMKYLPHRYPFLLVDRVLEFVSGKSLRALKNVTYNEPYFTGHFPHRPLMPGVIIMEALAQSAGLLAFLTWLFAFGTHDLTHALRRSRAALQAAQVRFDCRGPVVRISFHLCNSIEDARVTGRAWPR